MVNSLICLWFGGIWNFILIRWNRGSMKQNYYTHTQDQFILDTETNLACVIKVRTYNMLLRHLAMNRSLLAQPRMRSKFVHWEIYTTSHMFSSYCLPCVHCSLIPVHFIDPWLQQMAMTKSSQLASHTDAAVKSNSDKLLLYIKGII